ncbi:MAG TPA: class I SAM-dependent methyltransferase [Bryobacteraceae bacterium]|nr:class I SAM-dependent methyltransferase [Bryobacteraceae bacterium]
MQSEWFETFFQGAAVDFWTRATPPAVTLADCDFLETALALEPRAKVLDVPCGNGRHSVELARRGYRVTGVDISPEFLTAAKRSAREAGVEAAFVHGDMRALDQALDPAPGQAPDQAPDQAIARSPQFDAAFCFGNSFGYLDHANAGTVLRSLAALLRPGGRLSIATGTAAESILPALRPQRWLRLGDLLVLSEAHYAAAESRLDISYTFVQNGRVETYPTSSYVFTAAEYGRMLESAGFEVLAKNGGMAGEHYELGPHWLVLTARRR